MSDLPDWAEPLGLQPHPEGGWFAETYRSTLTVPAHGGSRALATCIAFLLLPGEQSAWHRVASDELWIHQRGGALDLRLGGAAGHPIQDETIRLGTDTLAGQSPQGLVPAGHWQSAGPAGDEPALVACLVAPGFDFADFTLFDA